MEEHQGRLRHYQRVYSTDANNSEKKVDFGCHLGGDMVIVSARIKVAKTRTDVPDC